MSAAESAVLILAQALAAARSRLFRYRARELPQPAEELAEYESGIRVPPREVVEEYARALGSEPGALVDLWRDAVAEVHRTDRAFEDRYLSACRELAPGSGAPAPGSGSGAASTGAPGSATPGRARTPSPAPYAVERRIVPRGDPGPGTPFPRRDPDHRRVLLRDIPGSGRGRLLRRETLRAAETPRGVVPFPLSAAVLDRPDNPPAPADLLALCGSALADEQPSGWAERLFAAGRALLLVEGVEDLPPTAREGIRHWLERLAGDHPRTEALVTASLSAVPGDWLADAGFTEYRLAPLAWPEVASYLATEPWSRAPDAEGGQRLTELLRQDPALARMARDTLVLAELGFPYIESGPLGPRRVDLYLAATTALADPEPAPETDGGAPLVRGLALWLQRNGVPHATRDQTLRQFERALPAIAPGTDPAAVLARLLDHGGLLTETAPDRIALVHPSVQSYLAAREAADTDALGEILRHAHEDRWREVAVFAVGCARTSERAGYLDGLLERAEREPDRAPRLVLIAAEALLDLPELERDLHSRIRGRLAELLPPRTASDADEIAAAGPRILPLLPDPRQLDPGDPRTALLRRAVTRMADERVAAELTLDERVDGGPAGEYLRRFPAALPPSPSVPVPSAPEPLPDRTAATWPAVEQIPATPEPATDPEPAAGVVRLDGGEDPDTLAALAPGARRAVCGPDGDPALLALLPRLHTVVAEDHARPVDLARLTVLPLLRTLVLTRGAAPRDLSPLAGTGVMFLEISPAPEPSVVAQLATLARLRVLHLPGAKRRYVESLRELLPDVALVRGPLSLPEHPAFGHRDGPGRAE
ncbi:hypothetical protein ABT354_17335 [Streptomyces sp. NPDC000594]|uniref:NACHT domain-containing protein n=1 Tax=Streptomyces sp. NPDC000594 TaxID=3154261 RepID=UPI0033182BF6